MAHITIHWVNCPKKKYRDHPYNCLVALGEHNRSVPHIAEEGFNNNKVLKIKADQVLTHPEYRYDPKLIRVYNDIGLLRLETPVDFNRYPNIRPACLPTDLNQDYVGRTAIIAGWGKIRKNGPGSKVLKEAEVKVVPFTNPKKIKIVRKTGASCAGDSGGPLIVPGNGASWEVIGVDSAGTCSVYSVYTRVTSYMYWILSNTETGKFCPRY